MAKKAAKPNWDEIKEKSAKGKGKAKKPPAEPKEPEAKVSKPKRQLVVGGVTQGRAVTHLPSRLDYVDKDISEIGVGPGVKRRAS